MLNKVQVAFPSRVGRLRKLMADAGVEALVCMKPETTMYLSGFNPIIYSNPVIVIITFDRDPVLLVFALRGEHARASAWTRDIYLFGTWSNIKTLASTWTEALRLLLKKFGLEEKSIGVEKAFVPMDQVQQLSEILPNANLVNASPLIDVCRRIKDADEIQNARIAGEIAKVGMEAAVTALAQRTLTERLVAISSMHAMNQHWAKNYPDVEVCDFGSTEGGYHNGLAAWILSGPRKSYACDNPTNRIPKEGETVSVFIWTTANGMHAELERTVCIGVVPLAEKQAIHAVLEIRAEAWGMIRPGTSCSELYDKVRKGFQVRGYGEYVPGRIGHSIGLGPHENLSIMAGSSVQLTSGMIITLEPHIHIPGVCGTQFSDTILITEKGYQHLTNYPDGYLVV